MQGSVKPIIAKIKGEGQGHKHSFSTGVKEQNKEGIWW